LTRLKLFEVRNVNLNECLKGLRRGRKTQAEIRQKRQSSVRWKRSNTGAGSNDQKDFTSTSEKNQPLQE